MRFVIAVLLTACTFHPEVSLDGGPDSSTTTCLGTIHGCGSATTPPSCVSRLPTCGPTGSDNCCESLPVPGGTFLRSYDLAADGMYSDVSHPATVSSFSLDRFEVTVGRFRQFIYEGTSTQARPPAAGAGPHAKIPNSGWDPSWDVQLEPDVATLGSALTCDPSYATWTPSTGPNEDLPVNCVTWDEAFAFCAWDGGYLPTEAESNYAAAGGSDQRSYPWSVPAASTIVDCTYANYDLDGGTFCQPGSGAAVATMNRVGSESPRGDGKWGQSDLGGNAMEWALDIYADYIDPCDDCANLSSGSNRTFRGGDFSHGSIYVRAAARGFNMLTTDNVQNGRSRNLGFRCARP